MRAIPFQPEMDSASRAVSKSKKCAEKSQWTVLKIPVMLNRVEYIAQLHSIASVQRALNAIETLEFGAQWLPLRQKAP